MDPMPQDPMSRTIELEEGACDSCDAKGMVYDFMGDYYCEKCVDKYVDPKPSPFPMQPIESDGDGVYRFRENKIVTYLLEAGPFDMNDLAVVPGFSSHDREQFAQLIGYSVSSFGDLSCASPWMVQKADEIVEEMHGAKDGNKE